MSLPRRRSVATAALVAAALLLTATLLAGCGGDSSEGGEGEADTTVDQTEGGPGADEQQDSGSEPEQRAPESADDPRPPAPDDAIGDRPGGGGEEDPGPPTQSPSGSQEREIEQAVRDYLAALRARDGEALCDGTFVAGALGQLRLPQRRGSCAASLSASIGHRPAPGRPRWLGASLVDSRTVILARDGAGRLTATVANRFSGSNRSWIEDDVIYLTESDSGADWLIRKPSATFYRALGYREVPITALTPP